jgi:MraZ protein
VYNRGLKWIKVERRTSGVLPLTLKVEQMFLGQYHHNLDEKGRLTIPAKFRDVLAEGAFLTQGFDRNLRLITEADFEIMFEKINHLSMTDPAIRQLRRLIFATASDVQLDRIGRTLIPQFLRDFAGLENEAVIVGVGEAIEIWSPEAWAEQESLLQDADANAQRFAELDLSL